MKAGITGHQDLKNYDVDWIKDNLRQAIINYSVTYGYTSLAIGADQIFVSLLREFDIKYEVIIPCRNYQMTFKTDTDKNMYFAFLKHAVRSTTLDYVDPIGEAFYDAGKKVVELSEIIFAVWDGKKARGLGGTGDIVKYAHQNAKKILHINPITKSIKLINND